jgi:hypothetical protein
MNSKEFVDYLKQNKEKSFAYLGLITILILGVFNRLEALDSAVVTDWIIRDFNRAFNIFDGIYLPLAGPDLTNGGRLPGPFLYYLLTIPLFFDYSYNSQYVFGFLLNVSSLIGLFFVLKKYFNVYFSILSVVLLTGNLQHIGAVYFPINPTFIFPLVVLFLFFTLEFTVNKSQNAFLLALFILFLGIQIHFQMAVLFLIPLFLPLIFKIKIPLKTVAKIILIASICFSPYAVHKSKYYFPILDFNEVISKKIPTPSPLQLIKMVTVQNTIYRITHSQYFEGNPKAPKAIYQIYYFGLSISFYGLFALILLNEFTKNKAKDLKKEKTILILFYLPALAYEWTKPTPIHYWYNYVFTIPQALVIASFLILLYQSIKNNNFKKGILFLSNIVAISVTMISFHYSRQLSQNFKNKLGPEFRTSPYLANGSISFKNSNILLKTLMQNLGLSPKEFYDKAYILNVYAGGLKRLKFAIEEDQYNERSELTNNLNCYFIMDQERLDPKYKAVSKTDYELRYVKFSRFLKDKTLNLISIKKINFAPMGFNQEFTVYEYSPVQTQSCYRNSFNPWVTLPKDLALLSEANDLKKENEKTTQLKTISLEEKYNSNKELVSFNGNYVFLNNLINLPGRLKLEIKKINSTYLLRAELEFMIFYGNIIVSSPNQIGPIDILIDPSFTSNPLDFSSNNKPLQKKQKLQIFPRNTLASVYNVLTGANLWNSNLEWYKEIELPKNFRLNKNQFSLNMIFGPMSTHSIYMPETKSCMSSKECVPK